MIYGNRDGTLVICRLRRELRLLTLLRQWVLTRGVRSGCACIC